MSDRVDRRVFKWFEHMERSSEERRGRLLECRSVRWRVDGTVKPSFRRLKGVKNAGTAKSLVLRDAEVTCMDEKSEKT